LKAYSILSGSALLGAALLSSSLILSARTLSAETLSSQSRQQTTKPTQTVAESTAPVAVEVSSTGNIGERIAAEEAYVVPPTNYVATAYSLRGRTASGRPVAKGLIAADPRHLPLGSRVRLEAGAYSGEYLVADTGSLVRGRRIDIWIPTSREAMRFGRRVVKLTVLSLGSKKRTRT
jgi:3D (Asp-Asp-Asp) domain-containing protein